MNRKWSTSSRNLLAKFLRIGPKSLDRILDEFGDRALDVLLSSPDSVRRVRGIGEKKKELIEEKSKLMKEFLECF